MIISSTEIIAGLNASSRVKKQYQYYPHNWEQYVNKGTCVIDTANYVPGRRFIPSLTMFCRKHNYEHEVRTEGTKIIFRIYRVK